MATRASVHRLLMLFRPWNLCFAVALLAVGCTLDEGDLAHWKTVKEGQERLTGYAADARRPLELRVRAARYLIELDAAGQLLHVLNEAPPADRKALLEPVLVYLTSQIEGENAAAQARAKDVLYAVLPWLATADETRVDAALADETATTLVAFAVSNLTAAQPARSRTSDQVILAAALVRPTAACGALLEALRKQTDPDRIERLARLLNEVGTPEARTGASRALLALARASLPALPVPLVRALSAEGAHRNETLLRFLLDAARDPEVPVEIRTLAIERAQNGLGASAQEGLEAVLEAEDPITQNALRAPAVMALIRIKGAAALADALRLMPDDSGWPETGATHRQALERICDSAIVPLGESAKAGLVATLADSNSEARILATLCLRRMGPPGSDEVARALAPVKDARTPLRGFAREPPPTLGDLARGKLDE